MKVWKDTFIWKLIEASKIQSYTSAGFYFCKNVAKEIGIKGFGIDGEMWDIEIIFLSGLLSWINVA